VRVYLASATAHLWLAATLLSLPGAGLFTQTFLVSLSYMLKLLGKPETLHGTVSLMDPHLRYLLECLHAVNLLPNYHIQKIKVLDKTGTSILLNKTYRNS